jgi:hypothetical protein
MREGKSEQSITIDLSSEKPLKRVAKLKKVISKNDTA